uniref:Uncharacterized protein n=1 Tax=Chelonoidis abingdonii TaxID=106734 RepID=A0A8C0HAJ0_CHEAB
MKGLTDTEQQRYSELFSLCCSPAPEGGSAPAPAAGGSKVGDLFRASQLPVDTLHQVGEPEGGGARLTTERVESLKQMSIPLTVEGI